MIRERYENFLQEYQIWLKASKAADRMAGAPHLSSGWTPNPSDQDSSREAGSDEHAPGTAVAGARHRSAPAEAEAALAELRAAAAEMGRVGQELALAEEQGVLAGLLRRLEAAQALYASARGLVLVRDAAAAARQTAELAQAQQEVGLAIQARNEGAWEEAEVWASAMRAAQDLTAAVPEIVAAATWIEKYGEHHRGADEPDIGVSYSAPQSWRWTSGELGQIVKLRAIDAEPHGFQDFALALLYAAHQEHPESDLGLLWPAVARHAPGAMLALDRWLAGMWTRDDLVMVTPIDLPLRLQLKLAEDQAPDLITQLEDEAGKAWVVLKEDLAGNASHPLWNHSIWEQIRTGYKGKGFLADSLGVVVEISGRAALGPSDTGRPRVRLVVDRADGYLPFVPVPAGPAEDMQQVAGEPQAGSPGMPDPEHQVLGAVDGAAAGHAAGRHAPGTLGEVTDRVPVILQLRQDQATAQLRLEQAEARLRAAEVLHNEAEARDWDSDVDAPAAIDETWDSVELAWLNRLDAKQELQELNLTLALHEAAANEDAPHDTAAALDALAKLNGAAGSPGWDRLTLKLRLTGANQQVPGLELALAAYEGAAMVQNARREATALWNERNEVAARLVEHGGRWTSADAERQRHLLGHRDERDNTNLVAGALATLMEDLGRNGVDRSEFAPQITDTLAAYRARWDELMEQPEEAAAEEQEQQEELDEIIYEYYTVVARIGQHRDAALRLRTEAAQVRGRALRALRDGTSGQHDFKVAEARYESASKVAEVWDQAADASGAGVVNFRLRLPVLGLGYRTQEQVDGFVDRAQALVNRDRPRVRDGRRIRVTAMGGTDDGGPPEPDSPVVHLGDADQESWRNVLQQLGLTERVEGFSEDVIEDRELGGIPADWEPQAGSGPALAVVAGGPGWVPVRAAEGRVSSLRFADFVTAFLRSLDTLAAVPESSVLSEFLRAMPGDLSADVKALPRWLNHHAADADKLLPSPLAYLLNVMGPLSGQRLARAARLAGVETDAIWEVLTRDLFAPGWDELAAASTSVGREVRVLIDALRRQPGTQPGGVPGSPGWAQMVPALLELDSGDGPYGLLTMVLPDVLASLLRVRVRFLAAGQVIHTVGTRELDAVVMDLAFGSGRYLVEVPDGVHLEEPESGLGLDLESFEQDLGRELQSLPGDVAAAVDVTIARAEVRHRSAVAEVRHRSAVAEARDMPQHQGGGADVAGQQVDEAAGVGPGRTPRPPHPMGIWPAADPTAGWVDALPGDGSPRLNDSRADVIWTYQALHPERDADGWDVSELSDLERLGDLLWPVAGRLAPGVLRDLAGTVFGAFDMYPGLPVTDGYARALPGLVPLAGERGGAVTNDSLKEAERRVAAAAAELMDLAAQRENLGPGKWARRVKLTERQQVVEVSVRQPVMAAPGQGPGEVAALAEQLRDQISAPVNGLLRLSGDEHFYLDLGLVPMPPAESAAAACPVDAALPPGWRPWPAPRGGATEHGGPQSAHKHGGLQPVQLTGRADDDLDLVRSAVLGALGVTGVAAGWPGGLGAAVARALPQLERRVGVASLPATPSGDLEPPAKVTQHLADAAGLFSSDAAPPAPALGGASSTSGGTPRPAGGAGQAPDQAVLDARMLEAGRVPLPVLRWLTGGRLLADGGGLEPGVHVRRLELVRPLDAGAQERVRLVRQVLVVLRPEVAAGIDPALVSGVLDAARTVVDGAVNGPQAQVFRDDQLHLQVVIASAPQASLAPSALEALGSRGELAGGWTLDRGAPEGSAAWPGQLLAAVLDYLGADGALLGLPENGGFGALASGALPRVGRALAAVRMTEVGRLGVIPAGADLARARVTLAAAGWRDRLIPSTEEELSAAAAILARVQAGVSSGAVDEASAERYGRLLAYTWPRQNGGARDGVAFLSERDAAVASSSTAPVVPGPDGTAGQVPSVVAVDRSGWVMAPLRGYGSSGFTDLLAHLLASALVQGRDDVTTRLGLTSAEDLARVTGELANRLQANIGSADHAAEAATLGGQAPGTPRQAMSRLVGLLGTDLGMDVVIVGPGGALEHEHELSALVPPPVAGQPARALVYLGWDGVGYHVYGPGDSLGLLVHVQELGAAQYAALLSDGMAPDPAIGRGGDALFASVIAAAGEAYLADILGESDPAARDAPVTVPTLRTFLADWFAEDYHSEPGRFNPFMAGAAPEAVENWIRTAGDWDAVLAAVTPRLVADHLGLQVSVLNQYGLTENLGSRKNQTQTRGPAERMVRPELRLVRVAPDGWLVRLVPGVPERHVVRGRPLIELGPEPSDHRTALDWLTDLAEVVARELARADAARAQAVTLLAEYHYRAAWDSVLEMAADGTDLAALAGHRAMAEVLHDTEAELTSQAEQAVNRLTVVAEAVLARPWVLGGQEPDSVRSRLQTVGELAGHEAMIEVSRSEAAGDRRRDAETAATRPGATVNEVLGTWTEDQVAEWAGLLAYAEVIANVAASAEQRIAQLVTDWRTRAMRPRAADPQAPVQALPVSAPGIPNGSLMPSRDRAPEAWRLDRGQRAWRPFAQYVSTGPDRAVTAILPLDLWLSEGHHLAIQPGPAPQPHLLRHAGITGAVVEVTAAGLWVRDDIGVPDLEAHLVRGMEPRAAGLVFTIGIPQPGRQVSAEASKLAWHLARHLVPEAAGRGLLMITADTSSASLNAADRLAGRALLSHATPRTVVGPTARPARFPRDHRWAGPLPDFSVPGMEMAGDINVPAAEANWMAEFHHGISGMLDDEVVVNSAEVVAYLTISPPPEEETHLTMSPPPQQEEVWAQTYLNGLLAHGDPQLQIPREGFSAWTREQPRVANEIHLRMRIPPGAAILPAASSRPRLWYDPVEEQPPLEIRLRLPLRTLARVRVEAVRAFDDHAEPVVRFQETDFDLASIVQDAPGRGSEDVAIPYWAFNDDVIDEYILPAGEPIPAG